MATNKNAKHQNEMSVRWDEKPEVPYHNEPSAFVGGVKSSKIAYTLDNADIFYAQAISYLWGCDDSGDKLARKVDAQEFAMAWRAESGNPNRPCIADFYRYWVTKLFS